MATARTYTVSFSAVERTAHGFRTTHGIGTRVDKHEITAASFKDLESAVRKLAAEFGKTCAPYIGLKNPRDRKPNGFDAFTDKLQIIDFVPPADDTAA